MPPESLCAPPWLRSMPRVAFETDQTLVWLTTALLREITKRFPFLCLSSRWSKSLCNTSFDILTSSHLTLLNMISSHLTLLNMTVPHLTSLQLTLPWQTSFQLTLPHLTCFHPNWPCLKTGHGKTVGLIKEKPFFMNLSKKRDYIKTKPCSNIEVNTFTRMTAEITPYHYGKKWYSRNFATPLWVKKMVHQIFCYTIVERNIYIKKMVYYTTVKKNGTPGTLLYKGVGVKKKRRYSEKFHYYHWKKERRNDTPEISPYHCGNNKNGTSEILLYYCDKKKRKRRNH